MEQRKLSFSIEGEFVTAHGRELLFQQHDLRKAVQWLTGCLQSDQLTDKEIEQMAYDVLNGRAEITGTYPNPDYRFRYIEGKEDSNDIGDAIKEWSQAEEQLRTTGQKLEFIRSYLTNNTVTMYRKMASLYHEMYEEPLFDGDDDDICESTYGANDLLQSFMERVHSDTEDDYGWLEPNGTFHPVEWGEHEEWAKNWFDGRSEHPESPIERTVHAYGDSLVNRGWVLLHNPAQGVAIATNNPTRTLTKQQKEFLYDYYSKRGQHKKANAIYDENN